MEVQFRKYSSGQALNAWKYSFESTVLDGHLTHGSTVSDSHSGFFAKYSFRQSLKDFRNVPPSSTSDLLKKFINIKKPSE